MSLCYPIAKCNTTPFTICKRKLIGVLLILLGRRSILYLVVYINSQLCNSIKASISGHLPLCRLPERGRGGRRRQQVANEELIGRRHVAHSSTLPHSITAPLVDWLRANEISIYKPVLRYEIPISKVCVHITRINIFYVSDWIELIGYYDRIRKMCIDCALKYWNLISELSQYNGTPR